MHLALDPSSDEPLFEQIVNLVRWRISVGTLDAGDTLPSTRAAAGEWGLNRHTVARAYRRLVEAGLLSRGPRGTVIVRDVGARARARDEVAGQFVRTVLRQAREQGIPVDQLTEGLHREVHGGTVTAVECTADQCRDLREQISRGWMVEVEEFCLEDDGEPPAGIFVSTLAHYEDLRQRWPHRKNDARFVPAAPSPDLGPVLRHLSGPDSRPVVVAVARDAVAGVELCQELSELSALPAARFESVLATDIEPMHSRLERGEVVLAATPHAYRTLPPALQASPFVVRIHYEARRGALEGLAAELSWRRRKTSPAGMERP